MAVVTTKQYRDEWIQEFTRKPSHYRPLVTLDTKREGLETQFLIVGTNSGQAVTRGANGDIPESQISQTPVTVALQERHVLITETGFNIFTGQSDQRSMMQAQGRIIMNQHIDSIIRAALETGTVAATGISYMGKEAASVGVVKMANAQVPIDDMIYCAITPGQHAILLDDPSYASADFVEVRPMVMGIPDPQAEAIRMRSWMGVRWFVDSGLPGIGTATATCYMWHRSCIGYAIANGDISVAIGYEDKHDRSYARHSVYHGAKKIQNAGIVKFTVDDTRYA